MCHLHICKLSHLQIIFTMSKKPFVLRIDPDKLAAIEQWAVDEFRSTNGQIEWILDQALKKVGRAKSKS
jgi:hypothetical protein